VKELGIAGRLAQAFIQSSLTPLLILFSVLLGIGATLILPREEEPQITVPMADVFVSMPGASPQEVEQRVTFPMEKLVRELQGVEYVYSTTRAGSAMLIVRFLVGRNPPFAEPESTASAASLPAHSSAVAFSDANSLHLGRGYR
jgi:multidrug efflux pump subunit AcrB